MTTRLWPRSMHGQMMLAIALALLLAQGTGAFLLYRSQHERREVTLVHNMAMRLFTAIRGAPPESLAPPPGGTDMPPRVGPPPDAYGGPRTFGLERSTESPARAGEPHDRSAEHEMRTILSEQNIPIRDIVVLRRAITQDPAAQDRMARRVQVLGHPPDADAEFVLIGAVRKMGSDDWLIVRTIIPPYERMLLLTLLAQTLLIYAVVVGAIALILRRITRPLARLTGQVERFSGSQDTADQLAPEGPEDIRRLIMAHNAMENRIATLLDEKDVMLGAIGHDLKTPLAALRVRIESVADEHQRERMAATIEDIARSLDDILSLARAGRAGDPTEMTELSALLAAVVEEYEDIGEPVELGTAARIAMPLRATWLRRAIRNLISNALRYGHAARVTLAREGSFAVFRIDDDGPGIPAADMTRMLAPFTRGEASRNSETGGAGLGLALALAIAEQHGGTLTLINRQERGKIKGLTAELRLPITVAEKTKAPSRRKPARSRPAEEISADRRYRR